MDQDVAAAIAGLRSEIAQLRSALGVQTPDEAEQAVIDLKGTVAQIVEWGATVTPPFSPAS